MSWIVRGSALLFGDDVNTDLLHPSYFYSLDDKTVRSGFLGAVPGREDEAESTDEPRIVVAGENFGCGSSRETTLRALAMAGVQAVVASSFGRIFFRNACSLGIPAVTCSGANAFADDRDALELDLDGLFLRNRTQGAETRVDAIDPFWSAVVRAGGLILFLRSRGEGR
ncbi:MAG: 3-isopropylmalate dehydratase [Gemmatimonadetes bacterium]|nr:3-isopropylmalate dehydratase [Gemmatimonadota bacterium]